jgi:hypothetical protein
MEVYQSLDGRYWRKADVCSIEVDDAPRREKPNIRIVTKPGSNCFFCFAPFPLPAGPPLVRLRCPRFFIGAPDTQGVAGPFRM